MLLLDERRAVEAIPAMLAKEPDIASHQIAYLRRVIDVVELRDLEKARWAEVEKLIETARQPGVTSASARQIAFGSWPLCARACCQTLRDRTRNQRIDGRAKPMTGLLRPLDLKQIASDAEIAKMEEERKLKEGKERQQMELRKALRRAKSSLKRSSASIMRSALLPRTGTTSCRC